MININEQTHLVCTVTIKHEEKDINVAIINANLSNLANAFNISVTIVNKELVELYKNEVQIQLNEFYDALKQKQIDIGYNITIR